MKKTNCMGFSLIEVLIYIALLTLTMSTVMLLLFDYSFIVQIYENELETYEK